MKFKKMLESVIIEIDGNEYELRFGHKAIKRCENKLGRPFTNFVSEQISVKDMEILFMCTCNVQLKSNQVEDLLDKVSSGYIIGAITKAYENALKEEESNKEKTDIEEEKN